MKQNKSTTEEGKPGRHWCDEECMKTHTPSQEEKKEECGCVELGKPYPKYCAEHLKYHVVPTPKEGGYEACDGLEALCQVCKSGMRIALQDARLTLLEAIREEVEKLPTMGYFRTHIPKSRVIDIIKELKERNK